MAASRDHGKNNTSGYSSSSSDEDVNIGFPFEFLETADFQCIICTHVIRGFTELPCGHAGCKLCIEEWEKRKVNMEVCTMTEKSSTKSKLTASNTRKAALGKAPLMITSSSTAKSVHSETSDVVYVIKKSLVRKRMDTS
uniref:RING-type domain-containing protein n=1 Tax=Clytia hemisphaerica TaxID=252671 RepID=A0A7M5V2I6_9CNID